MEKSVKNLIDLIEKCDGLYSEALIEIHNMCIHRVPLNEMSMSDRNALFVTWEVVKAIRAIERKSNYLIDNRTPVENLIYLVTEQLDLGQVSEDLITVHNMPIHKIFTKDDEILNIQDSQQECFFTMWLLIDQIRTVELFFKSDK